ncbi:MAG: AgmX/PglI C-terminal domain-containing protein [Myxococcaceae bacterium]|nr:AgmX/PglI C-terminal domain-containing protein [Myxococcaceae bacterium]
MTVNDAVEKTFRLQQRLALVASTPGVLVVAAGLVTGLAALAGLGVAVLSGGLFSLLTVRRKRAAVLELLANPERVVQVVPVVQRVQGLVTNYPVVLVADDGRSYRVATWASSVAEAVQPFLDRFRHARGADPDAVFAPDAGFAARFQLIGVMLGSMVVGGLAAVVFVTPAVNRRLASLEEFFQRRIAHDERQTRVLEELRGATVTSGWASCALESLEPPIEVRLDGAVEGVRSHRRRGWLISNGELTLDEDEPRSEYDRRGRAELTLDALTGYPDRPPRREKALSVVGVRRGAELRLRLIDLDDGTVLCEGRATVAATEKGSRYAEDKALAAAVMRPFCAQLERDTCATLGPEPGPSTADGTPQTPPARAAEGAPVAPPPPKPVTDAAPAGELTSSVIQSTVRAAALRTRACYEKALAKNPSLSGKLTVSFTIGADGRVSTASGTGLADTAVTGCVVKEFKALRFPPARGRKPVSVKYPLVFQPAK